MFKRNPSLPNILSMTCFLFLKANSSLAQPAWAIPNPSIVCSQSFHLITMPELGELSEILVAGLLKQTRLVNSALKMGMQCSFIFSESDIREVAFSLVRHHLPNFINIYLPITLMLVDIPPYMCGNFVCSLLLIRSIYICSGVSGTTPVGITFVTVDESCYPVLLSDNLQFFRIVCSTE